MTKTTMNTKNHGGKRANAGRKKLGRKKWQVCTKPETQTAIIAEARRRQLDHPGIVLEQDYGTTKNP